MRTNVEIDNKMIKEIMLLGGIKNKKDVIDSSIRNYLRFVAQQNILQLRGKISWEGDLEEMRTSKYL
jgi:Arc/MetJ family transcription regulator